MPSHSGSIGVDDAGVGTPWSGLDRRLNFFENSEIRNLIARAVEYTNAGVCVHLCGSAGLGKTTLALRVAQEVGRPVAFMAGNEWLTSNDLIGRQIGTTATTVVDKYVQSVHRTEKQTRADWRYSVLAHAMEQGHTIVFDEFTRATPEANATLLSVLEEGVLISTDPASPQVALHAHPDFRIILTSNPRDYVGVNAAPDAFLDRVVTIRLDEPQVETVAGVIAARTGLAAEPSRCIAEVVAAVREIAPSEQFSTLRSALLAARIAQSRALNSTLTMSDMAEILTGILEGRGVEFASDHIAKAMERCGWGPQGKHTTKANAA